MSYYRIVYIVKQDPSAHLQPYLIKTTIVWASDILEIASWIETGEEIIGIWNKKTLEKEDVIAIEKVGFTRVAL